VASINPTSGLWGICYGLCGILEAWFLNLLGPFLFSPLEALVSRSDIFAIMTAYSVKA
jgi:hypothetical protein